MQENIHGLSPALIGIIIKELGMRATRVIRNEINQLTQEEKANPDKVYDVVTSADIKAQEIIVKTIREVLPFAGIVAEEENLRTAALGLPHFYVTIDPVDGTKALTRKQSDGIGCLISFVVENEIIAALVIDIMTQEFYYYRPESPHVHRLSEPRQEKLLYQPSDKPRILLFDDPRLHSSIIQSVTMPDTGYFSSLAVSNGSIGVNMAKLWKGEVQAVVTRPVKTHPWDYMPVVGICKKLGYEFREIRPDGLFPTVYENISEIASHNVGEIICIHGSELQNFEKYLTQNKLLTQFV